MALIKNNRIVEDRWITVGEEDPLPANAPILVSLEVWRNRHAELLSRGAPLGVVLESDALAEAVEVDLPQLALVAINFPSFGDGRGFSTARILRERYGYSGELRAAGYVIRDQVTYLKRCGFDAFEFSDAQSLAPWQKVEREINVVYQPTGDYKPTAMQRRHSLTAAAAE
jgi:uncharacterized protein (DUF934 family)